MWLLTLILGCALHLDDLDGDGVVAAEDCDDLDATQADCVALVVESVRGVEHRCVLNTIGAIACDGDNGRQQLEAPEGEQWVALAAGVYHTCALDQDGGVACWGDNRYGQANPPAFNGQVTWLGATDWASIAEVEGAVVCWGLCRVER